MSDTFHTPTATPDSAPGSTSASGLSRRGFLQVTASAGLAIGLHLPLGAQQAASAPAEVNVWVVVKPDDTQKSKQ